MGRKCRSPEIPLDIQFQLYTFSIKPGVDPEKKPVRTAVHRTVVKVPGQLPASAGNLLSVLQLLFGFPVVHDQIGRPVKLKIGEPGLQIEAFILNDKRFPFFYTEIFYPLEQRNRVRPLNTQKIHFFKGLSPGSLKGFPVFNRRRPLFLYLPDIHWGKFYYI